jgi:hypothetical protein
LYEQTVPIPGEIFIYDLFNDVVCGSDYAASYGTMIDEEERTQKEVIVAYFNVPSRHSPGVTDKEDDVRGLSENKPFFSHSRRGRLSDKTSKLKPLSVGVYR